MATASMSAFVTFWFAVTGVPPSVSEPGDGTVTIFTFASSSLVSASAKLKFAAVKV